MLMTRLVRVQSPRHCECSESGVPELTPLVDFAVNRFLEAVCRFEMNSQSAEFQYSFGVIMLNYVRGQCDPHSVRECT